MRQISYTKTITSPPTGSRYKSQGWARRMFVAQRTMWKNTAPTRPHKKPIRLEQTTQRKNVSL